MSLCFSLVLSDESNQKRLCKGARDQGERDRLDMLEFVPKISEKWLLLFLFLLCFFLTPTGPMKLPFLFLPWFYGGSPVWWRIVMAELSANHTSVGSKWGTRSAVQQVYRSTTYCFLFSLSVIPATCCTNFSSSMELLSGRESRVESRIVWTRWARPDLFPFKERGNRLVCIPV